MQRESTPQFSSGPSVPAIADDGVPFCGSVDAYLVRPAGF
jgi:hypothetical protein